MKTVTVVYDNGNSSVFECASTSWGDQSRNLIMRGLTTNPVTGQPARPAIPFVLLPLLGVHFVMEQGE